ncbi:MAG: coproporphyrinogen III oxidase, partial [Muribaculaceae bacterium]|nr:coproporphyrinogen III oxidase [Muribaculaceae bacterium]
YNILRREFSNISLDLIFGLPGQTLESLSRTLDAFIDMRPEHISAYSLMYEERTALTGLRDSGRITEIDEEDSVAMFRLITDRLCKAGYERYEISNYSLPGFRSRHNSNYWQGIPYIGLGPGAHSYDGERLRSYNMPDLKRYIDIYGGEMVEEKQEKQREKYVEGYCVDGYIETEELSLNELREEMLLTRLRTIEGLSLIEYRDRFGDKHFEELMRRIEVFIKNGTLYSPAEGYIALTEEGVMISDEIMASLF